MEDAVGRNLHHPERAQGSRKQQTDEKRFAVANGESGKHSRSGTQNHDNHSSITNLLPGAYIEENQRGACLVLDHVYSLDYVHGYYRLGDLLNRSTNAAETFTPDGRFSQLTFEDFVFLDTETTGLMGAGTFAFMVGTAFVEHNRDKSAFIVRQYFMRDQADEQAMLQLLAELITSRKGLITFNGRTFDLPLLNNRYLMQRLEAEIGNLLDRPHIDLLHPSRRLWSKRIGSCSLGSLERRILGIRRSEEDVPGWLIPGLYMDYLRSGDASELLRVFYHNRIDMLSMITLMVTISQHFENPQAIAEPLDLLSLARWQSALGLTGAAESTLLQASEMEMPLEHYHQTLFEASMLLKRSGRRKDAAVRWRQIVVTHVEGISGDQIALEAHVELAKYYEWHKHDILEAHRWTEQALRLTDSWPSARAQLVKADLRHRLARLERKIKRDNSPE